MIYLSDDTTLLSTGVCLLDFGFWRWTTLVVLPPFEGFIRILFDSTIPSVISCFTYFKSWGALSSNKKDDYFEDWPVRPLADCGLLSTTCRVGDAFVELYFVICCGSFFFIKRFFESTGPARCELTELPLDSFPLRLVKPRAPRDYKFMVELLCDAATGVPFLLVILIFSL